MNSKRINLCIISSIICVFMFVFTLQVNAADIKTTFNGEEIQMVIPPRVELDNLLLPVMETFEQLGYEVKWLPEAKKCIAYKMEHKVVVETNNVQVNVNKESFNLKFVPVLYGDDSLYALPELFEKLGVKVTYDKANATVKIISPYRVFINTKNELPGKAYPTFKIKDQIYVSLEGMKEYLLIDETIKDNIISLSQGEKEICKIDIEDKGSIKLGDKEVKLPSDMIIDKSNGIYVPIELLTLTDLVKIDKKGAIINLTSEYVAKVEAEVKQKLKIVNSEEMFTMYCFMNYTGYDDEMWSSYHPVREAVRKDLEAMDINIPNKTYYTDKKKMPMWYIFRHRHMDNAPSFKESNPPTYKSPLEDLSKELAAFYKQAQIGELYNKYKDRIQEDINLLYESAFIGKVARWNHMLKLECPEIVIQYNPLDSYGTGYTFYAMDGSYPYLITIGPSVVFDTGIEFNALETEYLHYITEPIRFESIDAIRAIPVDLESIPEDRLARSQWYNTPESIIVKSFLRGLQGYVNESKNKEKKNDEIGYWMDKGFIYTEQFYDYWKNIDSSGMNYKEYINFMLEDLKEKTVTK